MEWEVNSLDVKNLVSSLSEKIEYWDQDVLNYVFDENYLEISPQFNIEHTVNKKYILPRNCLVHFAKTTNHGQLQVL